MNHSDFWGLRVVISLACHIRGKIGMPSYKQDNVLYYIHLLNYIVKQYDKFPLRVGLNVIA